MKNSMEDPSWLSSLTPTYISFFLHLLISSTASDTILLNCGSPSSETSSFNGKNWTGDIGSKFVLSAQHNRYISSTASTEVPSDVPEVPYMTARFSLSQFTYTFPVSPGPKFIRLYFYPASYSGFDASKAFFSVTADHYTLLDNFSASLTAHSFNLTYFTRDFCINVESHKLSITFIPSPSTAYAFVNGIEVFSMPPNLYTRGGDVPLSFVGHPSPFFIDNTTALEMAYQLDVGDPRNLEAIGIFGTWLEKDSDYLLAGTLQGVTALAGSLTVESPPANSAPVEVYATARSMGSDKNINVNYNLTWTFPVDSGFNYLVRLHFCEIQLAITQVNQRVFKIFINNHTAEDKADIIAWTGRRGVPVYRDYVVEVPKGNGGMQDLWVALHPNIESRPMYYDASLNGLEIIKLADSNNNLAGHKSPQHELVVDPAPAPTRFVIGGVLGGVVTLSLLCLLLFWLWRRGMWSSCGIPHRKTKTSSLDSLPSDLCRHFSFSEIKAATNNFDEDLLIGVGGFGNVYKGYIDGGSTTVAIKRGNPKSQQGAHEFQTEIEMLSKLRHLHLVSLIGYCKEDPEMILVYNYMAQGTLRDHLCNKTKKPPLPWNQRLKICIGAARGVHYLHTGGKHTIIHRDIKTTNILLDEKWVAKVSDFGLSKVGPITMSHTHISTTVKGSFGYLDPEYYKRRKLTEKSDVYSFGVVLFEVLCARPAVSSTVDEEHVNLAEWALHCHQKGTLDQIMDPYLRGKIAPECFMKFTEIAQRCLSNRGIERPAMSDVLWNLELALQLQGSADAEKSLDSGAVGVMPTM